MSSSRRHPMTDSDLQYHVDLGGTVAQRPGDLGQHLFEPLVATGKVGHGCDCDAAIGQQVAGKAHVTGMDAYGRHVATRGLRPATQVRDRALVARGGFEACQIQEIDPGGIGIRRDHDEGGSGGAGREVVGAKRKRQESRERDGDRFGVAARGVDHGLGPHEFLQALATPPAWP